MNFSCSFNSTLTNSNVECTLYDTEQSIRSELAFYWHLVNVKIDFVSTYTNSIHTHKYIRVTQSILLNFKRMHDRKTHIHTQFITYQMQSRLQSDKYICMRTDLLQLFNKIACEWIGVEMCVTEFLTQIFCFSGQ